MIGGSTAGGSVPPPLGGVLVPDPEDVPEPGAEAGSAGGSALVCDESLLPLVDPLLVVPPLVDPVLVDSLPVDPLLVDPLSVDPPLVCPPPEVGD